MKAFKVHNAETVKQEVNLPAGTYTYSCRVIPVTTSYTFRLDSQSFTFEGLTVGVLNKRMKHTFLLTEAVSFFYPTSTVGDCIYEPQIEEGIFATTPGAHPLDFERLISEAGIEIDYEALSLYAKKADVSAEIKIQADEIKSTVGSISNDVDGLKGNMTTLSQTASSISGTVTNHTNQITQFQYTVDQIYQSIKDVDSGDFSIILQSIGQIEMKVGATGQSGSIQLALDSIALTVYDEDEGMSAIMTKVDSITSTVYDKHGVLLSKISQNGTDILIKGSQITLEGAVTASKDFKILEDGSMEAKNGKFTGEVIATSGTFTGEVNATSGKIAGFTISGTGLSNGPLFNNDAYVVFRNDANKTFAGIGGNVLPVATGAKALARFENKATNAFYGTTNYAMLVEASGATRNIAINAIGDIVVKGAIIKAESTYGSIGYSNDITLRIAQFRRFLFYPTAGRNIGIDVPTFTQLTNALGTSSMPSSWSMDLEIAVAYNAAGTIVVLGQVGGVIVNNDGNNAQHNSTHVQGGIEMKKGDVLTLRYHSYSRNWLIMTHNH